jgi:hypothetical protein
MFLGRAMAQAVSHWLITETRVHARISSCGQSVIWTGFSPSSSVFPCRYHSTVAPHTHTLPGGWAIGPLVVVVQRHCPTPSTWTTVFLEDKCLTPGTWNIASCSWFSHARGEKRFLHNRVLGSHPAHDVIQLYKVNEKTFNIGTQPDLEVVETAWDHEVGQRTTWPRVHCIGPQKLLDSWDCIETGSWQDPVMEMCG